MPIVRLGSEGRWTNYHGTGTCDAATRFALRSGDAERGRDEIAIAAGSVQDWLVEAAACFAIIPLRPYVCYLALASRHATMLVASTRA